MQRREVLSIFGLGTGIGVVAFLISGCDADSGPADPAAPDADPGTAGADAGPGDAAATADACVAPVVQMHDTHAQALYYDGSLGPLTGIIEVGYVVAGTPRTLDFWHGHNGQQHRFTLEPAHFEALKRGEKITVGTSTVDGHAHTLFIDPVDEKYRVTGAPDVPVALPC